VSEFFDLGDGFVERSRWQAGDHLRTLRRPHDIHAEHAAAQVVV
jgi:hypothetical protein